MLLTHSHSLVLWKFLYRDHHRNGMFHPQLWSTTGHMSWGMLREFHCHKAFPLPAQVSNPAESPGHLGNSLQRNGGHYLIHSLIPSRHRCVSLWIRSAGVRKHPDWPMGAGLGKPQWSFRREDHEDTEDLVSTFSFISKTRTREGEQCRIKHWICESIVDHQLLLVSAKEITRQCVAPDGRTQHCPTVVRPARPRQMPPFPHTHTHSQETYGVEKT